jgi:hypothetical protein
LRLLLSQKTLHRNGSSVVVTASESVSRLGMEIASVVKNLAMTSFNSMAESRYDNKVYRVITFHNHKSQGTNVSQSLASNIPNHPPINEYPFKISHYLFHGAPQSQLVFHHNA